MNKLWLAMSGACLLLTAASCAQEFIGPAHPVDRLSYPVDVTADASGEYLWVVSGNFDLKYNAGAVLALNLRTHEWVKSAAFEVGEFPGPFYPLARDADGTGPLESATVHGYVLSRDDNGLYHVGVSAGPTTGAPVVTCEGGARVEATGILRCPRRSALREATVEALESDETFDLAIGPEPYAAMLRPSMRDGEPDLLLTGAMENGMVSTLTLGPAGEPTLVGNLDLKGGIFAFVENPRTRRIYAGSKRVNTLQRLSVHLRGDNEDENAQNPYLRSDGEVAIPNSLANEDFARNLAITSDGNLLLAAYRSPSTVAILDIAEGPNGAPTDRLRAKVPVGFRPGDIEMVPARGERPELAYVAAFAEDRVDVIDPVRGVVVDRIDTGRGPFGLAFVDHTFDDGRRIQRLYVSQFNENSVGVIELDPDSPYHHQMIAEVR